MKLITFYLPQFHTFPENDKWWGKGFTEWTTVRNAKKYFSNHYQPRIPLNNNYYCLTDDGSTLRWQAGLASKNGIYGFCFYHYWFDGKMLMEKPMEMFLNDKSIHLNYCICWANENWTRAWANKTQELLIKQTYGNKNDWVKHFEYLLQFFKDSRYIINNNKPMLIIYRPEIIPTRKEMFELWNSLAKENGFDGIDLVYQRSIYNPEKDKAGYLFSHGIEYQPQCAMDYHRKRCWGIPYTFLNCLNYIASQHNWLWNKYVSFNFPYDRMWNNILTKFPQRKNMYPGAFVDWDNTPRHKDRGSYCGGMTPQKFEKYLTKQIERTKNVYNEDYLFLFAWNEWGEGGYLEPDEKYRDANLKAIKNALINNGEFGIE